MIITVSILAEVNNNLQELLLKIAKHMPKYRIRELIHIKTVNKLSLDRPVLNIWTFCNLRSHHYFSFFHKIGMVIRILKWDQAHFRYLKTSFPLTTLTLFGKQFLALKNWNAWQPGNHISWKNVNIRPSPACRSCMHRRPCYKQYLYALCDLAFCLRDQSNSHKARIRPFADCAHWMRGQNVGRIPCFRSTVK